MTTQITTAAGTDVGVDIDGDDALARRAATDLRAFSPLYTRHVDRVYRYLRSRGQAPEDAADLTAVAFERAIVGIRRYESRGAGFAGWILRIARNAAIDAERRRRPTVAIDDLPDGDHPASTQSAETTALAAEERRELAARLARLRPLERDAIALRYAGGLTSAQIGAVIGKSEAATKKLLTRSLATLREETR